MLAGRTTRYIPASALVKSRKRLGLRLPALPRLHLSAPFPAGYNGSYIPLSICYTMPTRSLVPRPHPRLSRERPRLRPAVHATNIFLCHMTHMKSTKLKNSNQLDNKIYYGMPKAINLYLANTSSMQSIN